MIHNICRGPLFLVHDLVRWEWLSNVGFDYKIVTNPKVFKWPMAVQFQSVCFESWRSLSPAIQVYLGCRICALLMVAMALKMVGGSNEVNCGVRLHSYVRLLSRLTLQQLWFTCLMVRGSELIKDGTRLDSLIQAFAYIGVILSSILIALRA